MEDQEGAQAGKQKVMQNKHCCTDESHPGALLIYMDVLGSSHTEEHEEQSTYLYVLPALINRLLISPKGAPEN